MRSQKQIKQEKRSVPYSLNLFQETYKSASSRLIDFFTVHHLKNYIDFQSKTKFHRELIDEILRQLREFLKNKSMREFESILKEQNLEEVLGQFDEIYFRRVIFKKLREQAESEEERRIFSKEQQFEVQDIEDEILNQIQGKLVKIYAQL